MISALIQSQCQDRLVYPEDLPYWFTMRVGYGRVERWLVWVWSWPQDNAVKSDEAKPWGSIRFSQAMCELYPDSIPF